MINDWRTLLTSRLPSSGNGAQEAKSFEYGESNCWCLKGWLYCSQHQGTGRVLTWRCRVVVCRSCGRGRYGGWWCPASSPWRHAGAEHSAAVSPAGEKNEWTAGHRKIDRQCVLWQMSYLATQVSEWSNYQLKDFRIEGWINGSTHTRLLSVKLIRGQKQGEREKNKWDGDQRSWQKASWCSLKMWWQIEYNLCWVVFLSVIFYAHE